MTNENGVATEEDNYQRIALADHNNGESSLPQDDSEKGIIRAEVTLEERTEEAQRLLDGFATFFEDFAGDLSLKFKMNRGFMIDYEHGIVYLDTKWFLSNDYTNDQIIWAVLHELSHFRDLKNDAEGIKGNQQYIEEKSHEVARQISASEKTTINPVESQAWVADALRFFYNIFDDIHVNGLVERRAPNYERGTQGGDQIETLYCDRLFISHDYVNEPEAPPNHLQYLYKLLRERMVPGQEVIVEAEAKEALERKITLLGKEYTAQEIIETFIIPKKGSKTSSSDRYQILRHTFEPIFLDLLVSDLEKAESKPKAPADGKEEDTTAQSTSPSEEESPSETSASPFGKNYQEYREKSPDQFTPEQMDEFIKTLEEADEEKRKKQEEEASSPEEKAEKAQAEMDRAWAEARTDEKHSPEEIKDQLNNYRQIEQAISPYLKELSQLWQGIIFGSRREVIRKKDGPFQHGADLNVVEAIRQWPEIASGQHDMARVMDKMVREEVLVKTPELIRLRIVADLSGSMTKDRRKVLKETVVLLLSSLREFNAQLNMNRAHTKTKLTVDTELWGFGSEAKVLKPFKDELKGRDDQLAIIQAVEGLDFEGGSTSDHHALEGILESLTDQEKRDIDLKKTMEIVFEITDGGSDLPVRAKAAVDTLSEKGIIIRSFQVGTVSKDETEKFNSVWNINRAQPFGEAIGREIENLIPAVKDALRKYLGNIRL